jgi:hypothetical protein
MTELHSATPHIDRISPFQVHRIYQETLLRYFRNTWVSAPCSGISRCRNCAPNSPNGANSPSFYSSPPITTFDHTQISLLPVPKLQPASGQTPTSGGRLYSAKIRLNSKVIDSFKSVDQKVYIRVNSVYSVYSNVFEQHSVLFLFVLC